MKRITSFLLLLLAFFVSAQAQLSPFDRMVESEKVLFPGAPNGLKTSALDNADIVYHRCHWTVDPAVAYIQGVVTTYFVPYTSIPYIQFDLSDSLTVDSVTYHGTALAFSRPGGYLLNIAFGTSLPAAGLDSLVIYYHGVPSSSGFGSFIQGTHGPSSTPVLWTLAEPYGARDWWPCKQALTDKIDSIDIIITCPDAYRGASNGVLVSSTTAGGMRTNHWKHRFKITPYLVCFAVTNYAVYSDFVPFGAGTTEVLNYVYPEDSLDAVTGTAHIVEYMQLFDSLFGEYPFASEKYGHAQFGWGGGMEHQTMTFVGDFGGELLNHELAHHWFGDMITCNSWHDIWLNEGFATYCTSLCYEYLDPVWLKVFREGRINGITSLPDGSVYCTDTTDVSRIFSGRLTYSKGMMLLTTLRWTIGDSAFFEGMRSYVNDPAVRHGFASTPQFVAHMEAASGKSLSGFMDDWFMGEGFPSYNIAWKQDASNLITITVNQTQSHPSVSFYEVRLPLLMRSKTGLDSLVILDNITNGQVFTVAASFGLDSLVLDPYKVITTNYNSIVHVDDPAALTLPVTAFPNPATSVLNLQTKEQLTSGELIAVDGAVLRKLSVEELQQRSISLSGLASGSYLLKLNSKDKTGLVKFVKE